MRDSFVFYRGFFEALAGVDPESKAAAYDALCEYALNDQMPEQDGIVGMFVKMAKPQIDVNAKRYRNGKRGGRPKNQTETKQEPNDNQTITKPEPNDNDNENVNVNENVNENANENENEKIGSSATSKPSKRRHGEYQKVLLTDEELRKLTDEFGEEKTEKAITYLDEYIAEKNYKSRSHYLAIRRWVFDALDRQQKKAAGEYESRLPDWSKY